jgi:hypothetical protein
MLNYSDFYDIAEYGNENWNKGNFTPREVAENAHIYCADYEWSKANGEESHNIVELFKLLWEEYKNDSNNADLEYWIDELYKLPGEFIQYSCDGCGRKEWFYFSPREMENLEKHSQRQMLIQDAIPTKPAWVREKFCLVSMGSFCPECMKEKEE